MLKRYRRHFFLSMTAMLAVVMLAGFTVLGVIQYRSVKEELRSTMSHVLGPLSEPGGNFLPLSERPDVRDPERSDPPAAETDENGAPIPRERPEGPYEAQKNRPEREETDQIITVFYETDTKRISVQSQSFPLDNEDLAEAVEAVLKAEDKFGSLPALSLYYCKDMTPDSVKIAFADASYLTERAVSRIALLAVIYLLLMTLFAFISLLLSRRAAAPLERAIEMERQFVANISHDLKTPITVILTNNSILKASPSSSVSEQAQWIDSTEDAAKNMMGLVNEMLTLSSLESLDRPVEKGPVDLSSIAEKCVLQMESLAYDRGITLSSETPDGVTVLSHRDYTERIVSSLIENALKYEPDGGTVRVTLRKSRKKALLSVRNPGGVINPEDLPHIFERFYRGDKARDLKRGHGLGLSILKQMADRLGVEIKVASTSDEGTVFTAVFELSE